MKKNCLCLLAVVIVVVMLLAVPVSAAGGGVPANAPFGDSDPADFFGELNPGAGEILNVLSSAIVFPLCIISISLWFFRAYGVAVKKDTEKSTNAWLKIYKVLRKIHIPAGAATLLIGLYHTIFASINHGWSLNWGSAAMFFYLLGFITWLLRKKLNRRWLVLHQTTTLIATMCMLVHSAPYLKLVFTIIAPIMLMKAFGG